MKKTGLAELLAAAALLLTAPLVMAQDASQPQVSVVNLQTVQNQDGSQSVITPKGDLATLPGAGVNGNIAPIYMGSQGGFWYTDKTGQTIDLNSTVASLQARRARAAQASQVPQYAPAYDEQPVQEEAQDSGSGGDGVVRSALGTAAAAGMGAMAGAAMSNNYYNAPYGTPMYYGNGNRPYYYGDGEHREFEDLNANQKAVMYNKRQMDQKNQQAAVQQSQANRQSRADQSAANQQNRQQSMQQSQALRNSQGGAAESGQFAGGRGQHENFQKQQQWYQQQLSQNPQKFQRAEDNPFVSHDSGRRGERHHAESRGSHEGFSQRSSHASARASRGGGSRGGGSRGGRRGR
jgi:hypothetical protein